MGREQPIRKINPFDRPRCRRMMLSNKYDKIVGLRRRRRAIGFGQRCVTFGHGPRSYLVLSLACLLAFSTLCIFGPLLAVACCSNRRIQLRRLATHFIAELAFAPTRRVRLSSPFQWAA